MTCPPTRKSSRRISVLGISNTPFCITGWPIVDNPLNDTFGNRHSALPFGVFVNSWQVCKTDWTSVDQSTKHFVDEHNIRHRQNLSSFSISFRHSANELACLQNPPALCTWYGHISNAIVNAKNQIDVKICALKASKRTYYYNICLLFKCSRTNSTEPTFYD